MGLEDVYREVILDHYRSPRNRGPLARVDVTAEGVNPLCGDEVTVSIAWEDGRVGGVAVSGHGCSISQASGSMMSEAIKGLDRAQLDELARRFHAMLASEEAGLDPARPGAVLGDLEALAGVRRYPVRIKCASLPWTTLEQALGDTVVEDSLTVP
jgi:nitrogen fixation NifU-like protein